MSVQEADEEQRQPKTGGSTSIMKANASVLPQKPVLPTSTHCRANVLSATNWLSHNDSNAGNTRCEKTRGFSLCVQPNPVYPAFALSTVSVFKTYCFGVAQISMELIRMWLNLALNFPPSCFSLLRTKITSRHHDVQILHAT